MRNTTAAGVESAPVLQSASAWVLSRLAVLPARGRMAIRMVTATGITRRRPTIHPHRPIMHRGVAGIRITGATTPAESLSQKSRSSIIDSQGPLSQTEKSRSALAAATAQFARHLPFAYPSRDRQLA